MNAVAQTVLALSVALLTMMFGAGAFEVVVLVPSWRRPEGLVPYRELCRRRNPGHYYQVLAPVTILLGIGAFALSFAVGTNHVLAAGPLIGAGVAEAFTLIYFMPLNRQLFFAPVEAQPGERSRALATRWWRANFARLAIIGAGVAVGFAGLGR
jgi:hypothetical protein